MERKKERGAFHLILGFVDRIMGDHVAAYAAQTAYFLMMSFYPVCIVSGGYRSVYAADIRNGQTGDHKHCAGESAGICPWYCGGGFFQERRRAFSIRSGCAVVFRKRHAGADQRAEYHISCKRNAKLAGKQDLFHAVHVSVCYSADHQPSASGNGKQDP